MKKHFDMKLCTALLVVVIMAAGIHITNTAARAQDLKVGIVPRDGFVPDEKTAIKIAEAVIAPVFGEQTLEEKRPFTAKLVGSDWVVKSAVPKPPTGDTITRGGLLEVHINKSTGCITYLTQWR